MVSGGGCGMSEVYRLKRAGDNTPPWGTPVLIFLVLEVLLWYFVYPWRPFMSLAMNVLR